MLPQIFHISIVSFNLAQLRPNGVDCARTTYGSLSPRTPVTEMARRSAVEVTRSAPFPDQPVRSLSRPGLDYLVIDHHTVHLASAHSPASKENPFLEGSGFSFFGGRKTNEAVDCHMKNLNARMPSFIFD